MPTYDMRCNKCSYELEVVHKMSEPHPVTCPECHSDELKQVITSLNFQLKGLKWPGKSFGSEMKKITDEQSKRDSKRDMKEYYARHD